MRRITVAIVLLCASVAGAQIFAPISSTDTGPQLVTHINESHSGPRPIEPTLSCFPGPGFFPPAKLLKQVGCQGCAPTNPCTTGPYTLTATVECDDDGVSNCRYNCNHGTPPDLQQFYSSELGAPVAVSTSIVNALTLAASPGTSVTQGWFVRYTATVTVTVDPSVTCDVSLNLDGSGTPVRVATVANAANDDPITTTVTLSAEQVVNATSTTATVFAKASASGCTLVDVAGELSGAVTRLDVSLIPK